MFGQKIKIGDKAVVFFMLKNITIMISQTKVVGSTLYKIVFVINTKIMHIMASSYK